jgi:hypothetical protein
MKRTILNTLTEACKSQYPAIDAKRINNVLREELRETLDSDGEVDVESFLLRLERKFGALMN